LDALSRSGHATARNPDAKQKTSLAQQSLETRVVPSTPNGKYAPPLRLRDLAVHERPQEKFERDGAKGLSELELLALLIRKGTRTKDVLAIAHELLDTAGSLQSLLDWDERDLQRVKGIGPVKAAQLRITFEIANRVRLDPRESQDKFKNADDVYGVFELLAKNLSVEKFWVLCLNRKNRLLRRHEATSGTASSSLVHPREVFREAIRSGASAIICVHNHPSGDPSPSAADIQVTRQLREAARAVDIDLLDHVIIGTRAADPARRGFYSFRDAGVL
jgi:DNA repair protein RadC